MNRLTESNTSTAPSLPQAASFTGYDAAGQVTSSKDAKGNVTHYAYDDAGRRTTVTNALTQVTSFVYDNVGNQTSMTDALLHTTAYTYDGDNRRSLVTYPDQTFEVTAYDGLGRVTSRTDANGTASAYVYDALGRLTSVTQDPITSSNPGGLNLLTIYGYDEVGNRLTSLGAKYAAGPLASYAYTVDNAGHRTSVTEKKGRTVNYGYDNLYRLTNETNGGWRML